jgi:hypothetical protein
MPRDNPTISGAFRSMSGIIDRSNRIPIARAILASLNGLLSTIVARYNSVDEEPLRGFHRLT